MEKYIFDLEKSWNFTLQTYWGKLQEKGCKHIMKVKAAAIPWSGRNFKIVSVQYPLNDIIDGA